MYEEEGEKKSFTRTKLESVERIPLTEDNLEREKQNFKESSINEMTFASFHEKVSKILIGLDTKIEDFMSTVRDLKKEEKEIKDNINTNEYSGSPIFVLNQNVELQRKMILDCFAQMQWVNEFLKIENSKARDVIEALREVNVTKTWAEAREKSLQTAQNIFGLGEDGKPGILKQMMEMFKEQNKEMREGYERQLEQERERAGKIVDKLLKLEEKVKEVDEKIEEKESRAPEPAGEVKAPAKEVDTKISEKEIPKEEAVEPAIPKAEKEIPGLIDVKKGEKEVLKNKFERDFVQKALETLKKSESAGKNWKNALTGLFMNPIRKGEITKSQKERLRKKIIEEYEKEKE